MWFADWIPLLEVAIGDNQRAGQLIKASGYDFRYLNSKARGVARRLGEGHVECRHALNSPFG